MASSSRPARPRAASPRFTLLVGTRKGAFFLSSDRARRRWSIDGPHFLGSQINHLVLDPRDGKTLMMAARTGHLGPTVFRSTNWGRAWKEAEQPPAFPKARGGTPRRAVECTFWLTPGHATQPGVWWAGTSPHGLFRSDDGGARWAIVRGFDEHPMHDAWTKDANTPVGPITHSILIDPRDARHMYMGLSSGGIFETVDGGADWTPLNRGVEAYFLPDPQSEFGHDPHCVQFAPSNPDRLYHQNHCGIYRLDRPGREWTRIGAKMPKKVGDIGFPIVIHPRDADTAWVLPMDGTSVWPRTSPGGKPAVYRTQNGGKTWQRQDAGFPTEHAYWTVLRQAMTRDSEPNVGLYFGTTTGEVWMSRSEGESWTRIAAHLPQILSVTMAERG